MSGRRNGERTALWGEVLKRQANSGLSIRRFCETEGVSEASFYAWRRKLGRPSRTVEKRQVGRADGKEAGGQFIPLSLVDAPAAMELLHPLGYRLRLNGDLDPRMLANVLDAIDRSQNR